MVFTGKRKIVLLQGFGTIASNDPFFNTDQMEVFIPSLNCYCKVKRLTNLNCNPEPLDLVQEPKTLDEPFCFIIEDVLKTGDIGTVPVQRSGTDILKPGMVVKIVAVKDLNHGYFSSNSMYDPDKEVADFTPLLKRELPADTLLGKDVVPSGKPIVVRPRVVPFDFSKQEKTASLAKKLQREHLTDILFGEDIVPGGRPIVIDPRAVRMTSFDFNKQEKAVSFAKAGGMVLTNSLTTKPIVLARAGSMFLAGTTTDFIGLDNAAGYAKNNGEEILILAGKQNGMDYPYLTAASLQMKAPIKDASVGLCCSYQNVEFIQSGDWILDTGAVRHVTGDRALFRLYTEVHGVETYLSMANNSQARIVGCGEVDLHFVGGMPMTLVDVHYAPDVAVNAVAASLLTGRGYRLELQFDVLVILTGDGEFVGRGHVVNGLFKLDIIKKRLLA